MPTWIITLLPVLASLFTSLASGCNPAKPQPATEPPAEPPAPEAATEPPAVPDPQAFLNSQFDPTTQSYPRPVVRQALLHSIQHCRESGIPMNGRRGMRANVVATMEAARTGTQPTVLALAIAPTTENAQAVLASCNRTSVDTVFAAAMADDSAD